MNSSASDCADERRPAEAGSSAPAVPALDSEVARAVNQRASAVSQLAEARSSLQRFDDETDIDDQGPLTVGHLTASRPSQESFVAGAMREKVNSEILTVQL